MCGRVVVPLLFAGRAGHWELRESRRTHEKQQEKKKNSRHPQRSGIGI
jgi:hypothetical protein